MQSFPKKDEGEPMPFNEALKRVWSAKPKPKPAKAPKDTKPAK